LVDSRPNLLIAWFTVHVWLLHRAERAQPGVILTSPPKEERGVIEMADIIRVAAQSRSTAVAGAIAGVVRERGRADIQAIGAGAVNQADVICIPTFADVEIAGQERTAIRIAIEPR
jgi:stage V sporulation protein S